MRKKPCGQLFGSVTNNFILKAFIVTLFWILATTMAYAQDEQVPIYKLSVSFVLEDNLIKGEAIITLPPHKEWKIRNTGLNILKASLNGKALDTTTINNGGEFGVSEGGVLKLAYDKVFEEVKMDVENAGVVGSIISKEGISLTGGWYPQIESLAYYNLTAIVPDGFKAISEADAITEKDTPKGKEFSFGFLHPSEGIALVAGRYTIKADVVGDTEVYAYFFEDDIPLADEYIDYSKRYLKMYDEILGKYPFKRFSVVENFVPTGYSMATFTLLGRDVVRLPFIVRTSLGHEIVHQWFGNYVYVDPESGNWSEGLATYLSDHLYKMQEGEGNLYRKQMLVDYQSYVTSENAIPLEEFTGRVDPATKAVGYGKGAMLFHMLMNLVGDETFLQTLKLFVQENAFQRTSWANIRKTFERTSGIDLEDFFEQWLTRSDVPDLSVVEPRVLYLDGVPNVCFWLRQGGKPYSLKIKMKVLTDEGDHTEMLDIGEKEKYFKVPVTGTPSWMVLDPDCDLMRKLWSNEFPPVISRLLGSERRLVVVPTDGSGRYTPLTSLLETQSFRMVLDSEVKDKDLISSSVLLLGADGPVHRRLFGKAPVEAIKEGFEITSVENPLNPDNVLAIAVASNREQTEAVARKLFHYGKYSRLKFHNGNNVEKEIADSETGMRTNLEQNVSGVRPQSALSLDKIIMKVIDKDILYIGESHTDYEDHCVQLDLIRALRERGHEFAIGMEMFQKPFQKALDEYLAGKTTEKEFLKASKYFERWRFNYHLYREIVEYAKAYGIPLLALNADSDIVDKVSSGGLDALSEAERKEIPPDMDMTNEDYRRKLKGIFELHENDGKKPSFENFYQCQILWDETMAHTGNDFLKKNPDYQLVVLAGMGHVEWGYGIPQRMHRLNGKDYAIMIDSNIETLEDGMADYVMFPAPLEPPKDPLLGVVLKETEGKVEIVEVEPKIAAEGLDLKKGDVLVEVDGLKIEKIADVKIALFDHKKGDVIEVQALRKRFLGGTKGETFRVKLK